MCLQLLQQAPCLALVSLVKRTDKEVLVVAGRHQGPMDRLHQRQEQRFSEFRLQQASATLRLPRQTLVALSRYQGWSWAVTSCFGGSSASLLQSVVVTGMAKISLFLHSRRVQHSALGYVLCSALQPWASDLVQRGVLQPSVWGLG